MVEGSFFYLYQFKYYAASDHERGVVGGLEIYEGNECGILPEFQQISVATFAIAVGIPHEDVLQRWDGIFTVRLDPRRLDRALLSHSVTLVSGERFGRILLHARR